MALTSLISFVVKAACVIPLLATLYKLTKFEFLRTSIADSGISVFSNSFGDFNKVLAMSQKMFPFPITVMFFEFYKLNSFSMFRSLSSEPLYQFTTLLAETMPLVVCSLSRPSDLSFKAP